jgi:hypothetical protein
MGGAIQLFCGFSIAISTVPFFLTPLHAGTKVRRVHNILCFSNFYYAGITETALSLIPEEHEE